MNRKYDNLRNIAKEDLIKLSHISSSYCDILEHLGIDRKSAQGRNILKTKLEYYGISFQKKRQKTMKIWTISDSKITIHLR